jgi:hypothetical protein
MRKNAKEEVLMKCIIQEAGIELLKKFTVAPAVITLPHEPWSINLFE